MPNAPGHTFEKKRQRRLQRRKERIPRQSKGGYVLLSEFSSIDSALKALHIMTLPVLNECRQRQFYTPKLTRTARKRRGRLLEQRKAAVRSQIKEE